MQCRPNCFALGDTTPSAGRGDGACVRAAPDAARRVTVSLTDYLAEGEPCLRPACNACVTHVELWPTPLPPCRRRIEVGPNASANRGSAPCATCRFHEVTRPLNMARNTLRRAIAPRFAGRRTVRPRQAARLGARQGIALNVDQLLDGFTRSHDGPAPNAAANWVRLTVRSAQAWSAIGAGPAPVPAARGRPCRDK